ncbi:hypothetical protein C8J56DRAFT_1119105 [Mycena floridula]|nr:hypothetical protein C8J56DRAFT_1119105 [Mycena floridula]
MFKKLAQLATLATAFHVAAGALATGHYQIKNFQGRCFDFVPTSNNDYVPVVTVPCVAGRQSQIWNVSSNSLIASTYIIQAIAAPGTLISYASALASFNINALHQQIQLHVNPPPSEELLLNQVDAIHWTITDLRGGPGHYTAWAARADASLAAPLTHEDSGSSTTPDPQQLFTFTGPL